MSGHGPGEALAEEDGELRLGHRPLTRRRLPLLLGAVQDQEEELQRRVVGREMSPGPDGAAELGVQGLDRVGGVDPFSDVLGEGVERDDLGPGAPPALANRRVSAAPFALLESRQGLLGRGGVGGAVDVLQRRGDRLAVLVGGEVEAVAQQMNDCTAARF